MFFIKSEYLDKIEKGIKKIEVRIGENWKRLADGIREGKIKPIAIFKAGSRKIVMEIYRVEVHRNLKTALGNGKWKKMGLRAKTYHEAVIEIRNLYSRGGHGPTVLFWLRKLKKE